METSKQKNMVVLRNLPSNLVEEAYVVLKSSKKAKKLQKIERDKQNCDSEERKKEGYVIKEAEMLVSNCISKLEEQNKRIIFNIDENKKYRKLKRYAYISSIIIFLQCLLIIIK